MIQEIHLCRDCFEINKGFKYERSGQKICLECGGIVLTQQESADYIALLKSEIEALKNKYGEDV